MTDKFPIIEACFKRHGASYCMLTSGTDGEHGTGSLHYDGLAGDFRTWEVSDVHALRSDLQNSLGDEYDVVIESTHMHIEYDPS